MKLKANEKVDGVFLIKEVAVKPKRNSDSTYLDLRLVDKDNDIRAKMWSYCESELPFEQFSLQKITGKVQEYNGQLQIIVDSFSAADMNEIDISDYVPCAQIDIDLSLKYIYDTIDTFENGELKALTFTAVKEVEEKFKYFPAAVSCHDAVRGGLIHHTTSMLATAESICINYPSINRSLLLAGVILHDLAKIDEIDSCDLGIATKYTAKGNLLGHLVMGAIKVEKLCEELGISDETRMLVEHMILSHHGKPEYGAAKVPMILEAQVLNIIDDLDAKIYEFNEVTEDIDSGSFSSKVFALGNIQVYKPAV